MQAKSNEPTALMPSSPTGPRSHLDYDNSRYQVRMSDEIILEKSKMKDCTGKRICRYLRNGQLKLVFKCERSQKP